MLLFILVVIEMLEENSLDASPEQSQEKFQSRHLEDIPKESQEGQLEEITEELPVEHITIMEIRQELRGKSQEGTLEEIPEESQEESLKKIPEEFQEKSQAKQKSCKVNQSQARVQDMLLTPWGIVSGCLVVFLGVAWTLFGVYSKEFLVYVVFLLLVLCPGY